MPTGVNLRLSARVWNRIWLSAFFLLSGALPLHGDGETLEVKGVTYENAAVRSTSPTHITISHAGGISQIPLADLPPGWQNDYDYDPAVAARHRARIEAETRYRLKQDQTDTPEDRGTPAGYTKLKREIDFRVSKPSSITRAKDQGRRPVNSIYAVVTALEYAYGMDAPPVSLSEEFVLWAVLQTYPGLELSKGALFPEILKSIEVHGVCREDLLTNKIARPVTEIDPPSNKAINDALQRRNIQAIPIQGQGAQSVAQILFNLNQNRPIVVALRWPHYTTINKNPTLRKQTPLKDSIHTVTLIGYRPDPAEPDSVLLLFRNSFGPQWGLGGHGYVALEYLNKHLRGGFAVDLY
ncbi:MAG: hypothetical protein DRP71_13795 [Verrucomicrobia bacterium]|nr:MAG: hypothetical protein DRP71_13795 [Verrucomicrobiota bacterium]